MTITLFELVGRDDRRFSPYCWRTRLALAHKGLAYETVPVRFTDKEKIAFSGQGRVPVIRDGETVVSDSWAIACYLEDTYPDRPSLFGGETGRATMRFINGWADIEVVLRVVPLVVRDILDNVDPADRDYFVETREKRFGTTLDALHATRDQHLPAARAALAPARLVLEAQPFLSGAAPAYADYILLGTLQWARMTSPCRIIEADDPIYAWRERMLDLFDGLARNVAAYEP